MNVREIIIKKRNGYALNEKEIEFLINGYTEGDIPDYQLSSFLMAVFFNGMTEKETVFLTKAMKESGDEYDLKCFGKKCIDKHSTGGVGDKVSLICGPIAASLGIKVPMMCGRGLGHTGGTVDKLESIPGFSTCINKTKFYNILDKTGLVFSSQTKSIAPADKKMYALRDVTGTVESIPLITSSIMSKKLATGANGIVFDVKTGSGAFMKDKKDAAMLADFLVKIASISNRRSFALLTNMDEPLGCAVGNSLEVIESIECLKGNCFNDLMKVSIEISAAMIFLAGVVKDIKKGRELARGQINNGEALKKLKDTIKAQGGDPDCIYEDYAEWKKAKYSFDVKAEKSGFIEDIDAYKVGDLSCSLGAGRLRLSDDVDPSAGIVFFLKVGDVVSCGDILARVYTDKKGKKTFSESLKRIIKISKKKPLQKKLILRKFIDK
ncbi:MAG: thymidine phosphorylase [Candidatus Aureabacteria bacterium]|nr:thymidine phosphorylase [Candidatus Auribacterota bacterium]